MQTHEEAQLFVHDLNLFVTVQLLDETLAVLSLGKLFEDHGYSYEWVSGQKPRLTKDGKSIICKTDNFIPLVVPGLSTIPESSSSYASPSQDSLRREADQAPRELVQLASSSSSSSVSEREVTNQHPGDWCHSQKSKIKKKRLVAGFQRKSERNRIACIRTQFSGIRSETSFESGNEIKEAQY